MGREGGGRENANEPYVAVLCSTLVSSSLLPS